MICSIHDGTHHDSHAAAAAAERAQTTPARRAQAPEFFGKGVYRPVSVLTTPLWWEDPQTGARNVTGFFASAFAFDRVFNNTVPAFAEMYVLIECNRSEANYRYGAYRRVGRQQGQQAAATTSRCPAKDDTY